MPVELRGEEIGVMVNHDVRVAFFPIVKNAHTAMDLWLRKVGFAPQFDDLASLDSYEHVALVRDPVDRYVASLHQTWVAGNVADVEWEPFIDGVDRFNRRLSRLWTFPGDVHFSSQKSRVDRMRPDATLLPLEHLDWFVGFLEDRGLSTHVPVPVKNAQPLSHRAYAKHRLDHDLVYSQSPDTSLWRRSLTWQQSCTPIG